MNRSFAAASKRNAAISFDDLLMNLPDCGMFHWFGRRASQDPATQTAEVMCSRRLIRQAYRSAGPELAATVFATSVGTAILAWRRALLGLGRWVVEGGAVLPSSARILSINGIYFAGISSRICRQRLAAGPQTVGCV